MVLVAVAIGAGWLYSLVVTLTGGGDTFCGLPEREALRLAAAVERESEYPWPRPW